jgi:Replication-relaxation
MEVDVRRSRMRRTRTGKRIELTTRDLDIFRALARYRYLPSTYIHAFVGGTSQTRFKERLGDLFHEGYLDRPERQWEMADCRHRPVIHELGAGARRILDEWGIVEEAHTWFSTSPHRQFAHSLMVCEVLASIALGIRERPDLRFIAWPEILAKAPALTRELPLPFRLPATTPSGAVVPDGLFGIEYVTSGRKTYRFFALEADRGTMPVARSKPDQTSYLRKIAAYREATAAQLPKTHWGLPNLLVLTVTTSDARLADIVLPLEEQAGSSAAFLFKAVDPSGVSAPATRLLFDPWTRAGLPSLQIDR